MLDVVDLSTVINGQHATKKPKLMNQAPDISPEALTPVGPMASPVASQMSNMANPTKVIKITTRGRKSKGLKVFISFGIGIQVILFFVTSFAYTLFYIVTFFLNICITFVC